jgi:hypothetical protein
MTRHKNIPKASPCGAVQESQPKGLLRERDVQREYPFTVAYLRKMRRLVREGEPDRGLPFIKLGRAVYYRRESIETFLRSREIGGSIAQRQAAGDNRVG